MKKRPGATWVWGILKNCDGIDQFAVTELKKISRMTEQERKKKGITSATAENFQNLRDLVARIREVFPVLRYKLDGPDVVPGVRRDDAERAALAAFYLGYGWHHMGMFEDAQRGWKNKAHTSAGGKHTAKINEPRLHDRRKKVRVEFERLMRSKYHTKNSAAIVIADRLGVNRKTVLSDLSHG